MIDRVVMDQPPLRSTLVRLCGAPFVVFFFLCCLFILAYLGEGGAVDDACGEQRAMPLSLLEKEKTSARKKSTDDEQQHPLVITTNPDCILTVVTPEFDSVCRPPLFLVDASFICE